ncbi:hypothetical protein AVEN_148700-1 [Araneus ventricosus]|uniref:THAP-type domain-containing protein n=1 Tax=Araneus ventricosus TaxID=182803 RepID=A0A4Y2FPM1_ARAVE|nr:hypothetical protein AVEN_148700-1 [Araneus ventricosus]
MRRRRQRHSKGVRTPKTIPVDQDVQQLRVCEKHFNDDDIKRVTTFYKESTGETITAKLKKPRLKEGAIPELFPHCTSYLSSTKSARDGPEVGKMILGKKHLYKAIAESLLTKEQHDNKFSFSNFEEMKNCFFLLMKCLLFGPEFIKINI